jgi:hypothetical protein
LPVESYIVASEAREKVTRESSAEAPARVNARAAAATDERRARSMPIRICLPDSYEIRGGSACCIDAFGDYWDDGACLSVLEGDGGTGGNRDDDDITPYADIYAPGGGFEVGSV